MATTPPTTLPLDGIRTAWLDCIQVNLAVLADHFHGPGTHLRLGARLDLPVRPLPDGLPTADPTLESRLATDAPLAGLRPVRRARLTPPELLAEAARDTGVHYVVADSFHLPWLPYHGNSHMEHSFLLAAGPTGWQVTDAYRIETRWGAAVPGEHVLTTDDLSGFDTAELITFAPAEPRPAPPTVTDHDPQPYVTAYAGWPDRLRALEQLSKETWLLARARRLHAAYRAQCAGRAGESDAERAHLAAWDRLVEHTYLAHRRVARGRAEPSGTVDRLHELLTADRQVFVADPTALPRPETDDTDPVDPDLHRMITRIVSDVLGVPARDLRSGAALDSFTSFSSFRLVEIVERVERELGRELNADELVPERLRHIDDLCRLARRR